MDRERLKFEDLKIGGIYFSESNRKRYKIVSRYKDILWYQYEKDNKERSTKKYQLTKNDVDGNFFH